MLDVSKAVAENYSECVHGGQAARQDRNPLGRVPGDAGPGECFPPGGVIIWNFPEPFFAGGTWKLAEPLSTLRRVLAEEPSSFLRKCEKAAESEARRASVNTVYIGGIGSEPEQIPKIGVDKQGPSSFWRKCEKAAMCFAGSDVKLLLAPHMMHPVGGCWQQQQLQHMLAYGRIYVPYMWKTVCSFEAGWVRYLASLLVHQASKIDSSPSICGYA